MIGLLWLLPWVHHQYEVSWLPWGELLCYLKVGQLAPLAIAEEKYLAELAQYEIEEGASPFRAGKLYGTFRKPSPLRPIFQEPPRARRFHRWASIAGSEGSK